MDAQGFDAGDRAPAGPRQGFARLVRGADRAGELDVAHAALLIAAESEPDLDVQHYLRRLDELAEAARRAVRDAPDTRSAVEALNHVLFVEHGFRGNQDDYYDPRNSFLNDVIDRRSGIPITLAVVYVEVARRLGLEAYGVSFPGHFLAKVVGDEEIFVDAFHGVCLTREGCADRLRSAFGAEVELEPQMLRAASPKQILARMLSNLKQIYVRKNRLEDALACSDRLLLLDPEAALELRDRGLFYRHLECFSAALRDLEGFLALAPQHESAVNVRRMLDPLRDRAAHIH